MVQGGSRSETGLFVITYPVQFVPGVRHGRPNELIQGVQAIIFIPTSDATTIMYPLKSLKLPVGNGI